MANLNKVMLMGNLTRDIEMRFTPSGMAVGKFGLAINRKYRDTKTNDLREEVTFVDVELFGKQAETASQYLSKGKPIYIEGRLKFDSWDDKTTGQKRSKLYVVGERFQFLGTSGQGGGGGGGGGAPGGAARPQQARPPQRNQAPSAPDQDSGGDDGPPPEDLDIQEESIPF